MTNKPPHSRYFCECGSAIHIAGPFKAEILRHWELLHQGDGHRDRVTAKEAEAIRAQLRQKARRKDFRP